MERVQRILKERLYRVMRQKKRKPIEQLQNVVASYNQTPHRGLSGMAPNDVNKNNEADVWAQMYLKKSGKDIAKPTFQFKKGDLVRINFTKQLFQRAYQKQFTTKVF